MIDLDKVDNAKALLKKWCDDGMESISTPIRYGQLLGLMNRLSAAEKDAARYRWLRDTADVDGTADLMISIIVSDEWDSLIDEAMQCK